MKRLLAAILLCWNGVAVARTVPPIPPVPPRHLQPDKATPVPNRIVVARTTLPVPPVPPRHPPSDEAAPIPDRDARAPVKPQGEQTRLNVEFYRMNDHDTSQGFAPGSKYQSDEDRKAIQTPGLSVTVPFH